MTFSIPIDIKRCILEGIEPPDDAMIQHESNVLKGHIIRNAPIAKLSAQSRFMLTDNQFGWFVIWGRDDQRDISGFRLSALPKFPLLMPDDDFAAAINDYAAKWGNK